jgi:hypothetical protein
MIPIRLRIAFILYLFASGIKAADNVPVYSVFELTFKGSEYRATDNPVRDIELITEWQNSKTSKTLRIFGFYDGDGKGGSAGNVFKVRFCPVQEGTWTLVGVKSNDSKLDKQYVGLQIKAIKSDSHGFWIVDNASPGRRWYRRSDGSHQYITGNTMYSFLSECFEGKPSGGNIKDDITGNSLYFKKVRIGITGDRYPNPSSKPFLDAEGRPTDDGSFSHRPNPEWFLTRVDVAVNQGFQKDLIVDLILNGPDTKESRSVLQASANNNDAAPFLRYIAARYCSFPNVWICLSNEFDIKVPVYKPAQIAAYGITLMSFLPYETPISVHSVRNWTTELNNPGWFDHVILQDKLKKLQESADIIELNYDIGRSAHPVIDDELAYEGAGDGWNEEDVIEAFLGAFAGGGYASTGLKTGNKTGHYFSGNFKASEHKAADNLLWFRQILDRDITFWMMKPVKGDQDINNIFGRSLNKDWRVMDWDGNEYVIAANSAGEGSALLPNGKWTVKMYDVIAMKESTLSEKASVKFNFEFTNSRAQLIHFKRIK